MKQTVKLKFQPLNRLGHWLVLSAWAVVLGGCSSNLNSFGDPASTGGASTVSQARQEAPGTPPPSYPAVHDMPAPRNSTILTDYEQKKLENDLIAARRRVAPDADKPAAKAKPEKGKAQASKSEVSKSEASKSEASKSEASKSAAPQKTGNKQDP